MNILPRVSLNVVRRSHAARVAMLTGVSLLAGIALATVAALPAGAVTTYASDSYNRTVSGGWGTADAGGAWTLIDTSSNWSVTPGSGSIVVPASSQQRAYLGSVAVQDVEMVEEVTLPRSTQTNNTLAYLLGRYTGGASPTYYRVGVGQGAGNSNVILRAQRQDNTSLTSDVNTGIAAADGIVIWLRVQFEGINPTTVRARAWLNGGTEPTNWQLTATDGNGAQQIAGAVGVRGRNDDTSASHTIVYHSFQATSLSTTPSPTPTPTPTPSPSGTAAADAYGRTVSNGWGSADTGGYWTVVGTPPNWSVSAGTGTIVAPANGQERAYLSAFSIQDVDLTMKVVLPRSSQSNNTVAYLMARYTPAYAPTYYRVGVGQGAGSSTIFLRTQRADGSSISADTNTGIAAANNAVVWMHLQLEGVNPTAIRARAWPDGTTEPASWMVSTTDSDSAEQTAGMVGLRMRNEDTSGSHSFGVESFQATGSATATPAPPPNPSGSTVHHYLYVFPDGEMDVYDMDNNHALVKRVTMPTSGGLGVAVSPSTGMLYLSECGSQCDPPTAGGQMLKYNLVTDTVVWVANYPFGVDSMALTPDGKTLYSPDGESSTDGLWHILDAGSGAVLGSIFANEAEHNTVVSLNGAHAYLGGYSGTNADYLQVVDTATNTITKKIGPLTNGVRPFTINGAETLAFTTATNFLGFQVSSITSGQVLYTVPINGFTWTTFVSTAPSHGITLSPDEKEVYVMDGPNDYVHVFDVTGLPSSAPKQVADLKLSPMTGSSIPCAARCEKEGWLLHSGDGRFVYVGDSGDVISTATRTIVATLAPLGNTRKFLEVDWQNGTTTFTTTRHGLGYVNVGAPPPPPPPPPPPAPFACASGALACDTYNRTVSNNWGSADVGGAWTIVGTPSNWSVSSGVGSVNVGPAGQERAYLSGTTVQDAEVLQKVVLPRSTQANNDLAYVLGRYVVGATDTYYRVGVGEGSGSSNILIRGQRNDGTNLGADVNTGIAASDGAIVWLRVQFQGIKPTAIRARAWLDGTSEPSGWMLDTTDVNPAEQIAGLVGVRDRNEDSSGSHTFKHEGFQVIALSAPASICPAGAVACDAFNRSVSGGWGSADVGGAWSSSGSIYSVTPGAGTIVVNSTAPQTFLPSVSVQDVDARAWISFPALPATGDAGIAVRYGSTGGTYYQVSAYYPSGINGSNYVVQLKRKPENVLINPDFKTSIAGGMAIWLRLRAVGTNPTQLSWKIWPDGTPEPSTWTGTAQDSNAAEQGAGGVGVEGYMSSGTASMAFNGMYALPASLIAASLPMSSRVALVANAAAADRRLQGLIA